MSINDYYISRYLPSTYGEEYYYPSFSAPRVRRQQVHHRRNAAQQGQQQSRPKVKQSETPYETVLAYGPYGELYRVQVPLKATRKQNEPRKRQGKPNTTTQSDHVAQKPMKVESLPDRLPPMDIDPNRKKGISIHEVFDLYQKPVTHNVNDTSNIEICVEDVTEEELYDGKNTTNSDYTPGPGESWMEPVEHP